MHRSALALVLAASIGLAGCAVSSGQSSTSTWTTGFWFWSGSSTRDAHDSLQPDVLFVQVGTIHKKTRWDVADPNNKGPWSAYATWPNYMPKAKEYWMVFRYEQQGLPDSEAASAISASVNDLLQDANAKHLPVTGVQLDIDSPTSQLAVYAGSLREVRKGLPKDCQLSITALLDWFRSGTNVDQVIRAVDEFVPQFYDAAKEVYGGQTVIASKIDAAHWGPAFNRFAKRFRIGISSFGRAQLIRSEHRVEFLADVTPLDIATNRNFRLEASTNQANEVALNYTTSKKIKLGYTEFSPGDGIQFILATPDSIRAAIESARQIKGNLAGVVFFRWPAEQETLAMQPEEVLAAAGIAPHATRDRIDTIDGHCAAVHCVDVYLKSGSAFSSIAARYRIKASTELEYFLPEKNMPVRLASPAELELSLPPYCARGRLFLGRAVSAQRSVFTVEQEQ